MTTLEQRKKNLIGQIDEAAKQYKFEDCIEYQKELKVLLMIGWETVIKHSCSLTEFLFL